jgi:uncharacterized protein
LIYAIIGALLIGACLGIFGSGGSILTVPVLVYLLKHDPKIAIAESLAIVGVIALVSALQYAKSRAISWRTAMLFGLPGMVGTLGGAWIAGFVSGSVQLVTFGAIMLLAAVMMWQRASATKLEAKISTTSEATESSPKVKPLPLSASLIGAQGVGVGLVTGFVGVGGGFLIVPALVLLCRHSMRTAIGTSLVIIVLNCVVGFGKHAYLLNSLGQQVNWRTIGLFILLGAAGSIAGRQLNARFNQTSLQRGFAIFLLLMGLFILLREGIGS